MVDKQSIIFLYRRGGQSLREISKTLNLHRATVTKVIREYEESLKADNPDAALDTVLTTLPEYKSNDRPARVVKGEVVFGHRKELGLFLWSGHLVQYLECLAVIYC